MYKSKIAKRPLKVGFMVGQFPKLSETFILNQITGLIECGHEVYIFPSEIIKEKVIHPDINKYNLLEKTFCVNAPSNKLKRFLKGIKLFILNFSKNPKAFLESINFIKYGKVALSLKLLYRVVSLIDKSDMDVILCHFGNVGLEGLAVKKALGIKAKLVTTFHGYDISAYICQKGKNVYNPLFEEGSLLLPISENWKNKLIELGAKDENIIVHRMGVDPNKFYFKIRSKSEKTKIITIARLVEKKGIEYAIRAVAAVIKENMSIEYRIVGDGPLKDQLNKLINDLGVSTYIKILGWKNQNEIVELVSDSDILLAPSVTSSDGDQEGIPVAIMEALSQGLIVISTSHSGIPELVIDGKTGFLVSEKNVIELKQKLLYVLDNPEIWQFISQGGRKIVEENYNIKTLNTKLEEILCKSVEKY